MSLTLLSNILVNVFLAVIILDFTIWLSGPHSWETTVDRWCLGILGILAFAIAIIAGITGHRLNEGFFGGYAAVAAWRWWHDDDNTRRRRRLRDKGAGMVRSVAGRLKVVHPAAEFVGAGTP